MQRPRIGVPIQLHQRALCFGNSIIRNDSQSAIQDSFLLGVAPEKTVIKRSLDSRVHIARVEISSALEILCGSFPTPLASLDIAHQQEYSRVIGQALPGNFQFGQSAVIIEVPPIKVPCACKVCFASIRPE